MIRRLQSEGDLRLLEFKTGERSNAVPEADARPAETPNDPPTLRCDTCGRATAVVSRVVIDEGYDRSNARPLWNCAECYAEKERRRREGERR